MVTCMRSDWGGFELMYKDQESVKNLILVFCVLEISRQNPPPSIGDCLFQGREVLQSSNFHAISSEGCYVLDVFKMQSVQGQEWSRCTEGKSVFAHDYTPVSSVNGRT